jgi:hypothetical protein
VVKGHAMRFLGVSLVVSMTVLATAVAASAYHPTGIFTKFAQCPLENSKVEICAYAESTSGMFQFGGIGAPVVRPEILQGGYYENPETGELQFVDAANGQTLVKTIQSIPGGLLGHSKEGRYPLYFRNFCKNFPSNSECTLTAAAELVGELHINTTHVIFEEGTGLEMPMVLHLKNPLLGSKCFIGSPSEPIIVKLTTGPTAPPPPNMPAHGSAGALEILDEGAYAGLKGDTFIDNAFAAPHLNGCGGPQAIVLDRELDEKNLLPSPAGHNTMVLGGELAIATKSAVAQSEES